ncbi:uncharacterized protein BX664DRAFT_330948 [Halteromyces radiatus]|uniref:uncharacterized protein n=1 Tax=Halteromyces radiatus TaxID=101107 RepID=UPI00221FF0B3|nr:uncharacterized protein BX664DRAFT_330948 [Halteromyces radiatus]KAI8093909.1 hypothetical protein BX664DRAFT_330948 [Halteromyces radiatus]
MSSVSSHDGSDKDSLRLRGTSDGLPSRYASLRKTDLLDAMESVKNRDTDSWSVAATIDDQESVISVQGGLVGLSSNSTTHLDDTSSLNAGNNSTNHTLHGLRSLNNTTSRLSQDIPLETLRDLDDQTSTGDDEDKRSRSNAAEFGDDGTRSAKADFDDTDSAGDDMDNDDSNTDMENHSSRDGDNENNNNDDNNNQQEQEQQEHQNQLDSCKRTARPLDNHRRQRKHIDVVNDSIAAPPQPQPSFTAVTKSYVELLEENDILQTQIQNLRLTQKHQAQVIDNLRTLTECNEKVFDKAVHLSQEHLSKVSESQQLDNEQQQEDEQQQTSILTPTVAPSTSSSSSSSFVIPPPPVVFAHTISDLLTRLAECVNQFVKLTVDVPWQLLLEQHLFTAITDAYLVALPFGTDNQQLLNTAYRDQLRRFQSTLGSSFAKWYRRQTVQSLSLNPATKEYLEHMHEQLSIGLLDILDKHGMQKSNQPAVIDQEAWKDVLQWCRNLSLEIHGGEADVIAQPITIGSDYDSDIMLMVADKNNNNDDDDHKTNPDMTSSSSVGERKKVKFVVNPLFIDEDDRVLLLAKVLLE